MLVACRLAGLSALGAHYAGVKWCAQCGADAGLSQIFIAGLEAGFGGPRAFSARGGPRRHGRFRISPSGATKSPNQWSTFGDRNERRNIAKGQKAMATAITFPEPEKGGPGEISL